MTQLLISVTNLIEAKIALENGADIIDLKDPSAGALGALPVATITSIVDFVNKGKLTSATIGDLYIESGLIISQIMALVKTNVDYIKIGFFETSNFQRYDFQTYLNALEKVTQTGVKLIAVLFAEHTYPESLILALKKAGFIGVMLDTAKKNGLTVLDYYTLAQLKNIAQNALKHELSFGLAGSLNIQHIAVLQEVNSTYMGFRGGICDSNKRELGINVEKIKAIRAIL